MALLLEKLNLRCTWEIHVDTQRDNWGVELSLGQEDWSEGCGSH